MTDWRPISTAPQTGEHILLFYPDSWDLPIRIGRWSPGGYWYAYSGPIHRRLERGPTLWMPLPKLPGGYDPYDPAPAPLPDPPPRKAGAIALPIPPEEPAA